MTAVRIDAGALIPGRGDPISDGSVVFDGARITYAGPAIGAPSATEVVEVATVMPGVAEHHEQAMKIAVAAGVRIATEPTSS